MNNIHDMLGCYANIWIRQKVFNNINETIGGHKHKYDHISLLASGSAKVEVDSIEKIFKAPTFIIIRKDKIHNVTALENNTLWYCIFANRDIDGQVYDKDLNDPLNLDNDSHYAIELEKLNNITIQENNVL